MISKKGILDMLTSSYETDALRLKPHTSLFAFKCEQYNIVVMHVVRHVTPVAWSLPDHTAKHPRRTGSSE